MNVMASVIILWVVAMLIVVVFWVSEWLKKRIRIKEYFFRKVDFSMSDLERLKSIESQIREFTRVWSNHSIPWKMLIRELKDVEITLPFNFQRGDDAVLLKGLRAKFAYRDYLPESETIRNNDDAIRLLVNSVGKLASEIGTVCLAVAHQPCFHLAKPDGDYANLDNFLATNPAYTMYLKADSNIPDDSPGVAFDGKELDDEELHNRRFVIAAKMFITLRNRFIGNSGIYQELLNSYEEEVDNFVREFQTLLSVQKAIRNAEGCSYADELKLQLTVKHGLAPLFDLYNTALERLKIPDSLIKGSKEKYRANWKHIDKQPLL